MVRPASFKVKSRPELAVRLAGLRPSPSTTAQMRLKSISCVVGEDEDKGERGAHQTKDRGPRVQRTSCEGPQEATSLSVPRRRAASRVCSAETISRTKAPRCVAMNRDTQSSVSARTWRSASSKHVSPGPVRGQQQRSVDSFFFF